MIEDVSIECVAEQSEFVGHVDGGVEAEGSLDCSVGPLIAKVADMGFHPV